MYILNKTCLEYFKLACILFYSYMYVYLIKNVFLDRVGLFLLDRWYSFNFCRSQQTPTLTKLVFGRFG